MYAECSYARVCAWYAWSLMTSLGLMSIPTLCPCVSVCTSVCMRACVCLSHADLGTHKHRTTPVDKWRMAQSPTPDVTASVSLRDGEREGERRRERTTNIHWKFTHHIRFY